MVTPCEKCKFADQAKLRLWKKGKEIPFCTYPGGRVTDKDGNCHSGRPR